MFIFKAGDKEILESAKGVAIFAEKDTPIWKQHERLTRYELLDYLDNWYDERKEAYTLSEKGRELLETWPQ